MKHRKDFKKTLKETRNFKSQKSSIFLYDLINTNHRQISLTGIDHFYSKLSKAILFEKKKMISQFFNI